MSENNVKMKTSAVGPKQSQTTDSYEISSNQQSENPFDPAGSSYENKDSKSVKWGTLKKGKEGDILSDMTSESVIGIVGEFCEDMNQAKANTALIPNDQMYVPKNPFERLRMFFEMPDPTDVVDLTKELPPIPTFGELRQSVDDLELVENFYLDRLLVINDLIDHSMKVIEDSTNGFEINKRKEFLDFLAIKKDFVHDQLDVLYKEKNTTT